MSKVNAMCCGTTCDKAEVSRYINILEVAVLLSLGDNILKLDDIRDLPDGLSKDELNDVVGKLVDSRIKDRAI